MALPEIDEFAIQTCSRVATRMTETGLRGSDLRETKHLDPFMKDALEEAIGVWPVSRKFASKSFVGLGAVDIVADQPRLFMELKWSYKPPGKVFESVWDAIKLAVLGPEHGWTQLYIATGATKEEWGRSECADLFETGTVDPLEMWERPLIPKRGPNYGRTVGEDLVIGANGNQPSRGPRTVLVRSLDSFPVADDFELKLIGLSGTTDLRDSPQISLP